MKVTIAELKAIKELTAERDRAATELGAAVYEFRKIELGMMQKIENASAQQDRIGMAAIRAAGFDPDAANYTIDLETGEIKTLVNGEWRLALLPAG